MSLGSNIYNLRKECGLSQEELGNICRVSRQTVSRWEADEVMPDTNNLLALSKYFKMTIDELINNDVKKKEPDVFDKSINLLQKHWAKGGYYLIFTGILAFGMSMLISYNTGQMFSNPFGIDINSFETVAAPDKSIFTGFSLFVMVIGTLLFVCGIALVIYDRHKNSK